MSELRFERARQDRRALEQLLADAGLEEVAARIAESARVGCLLDPVPEGDGSRLGGPALLPEGERWPVRPDGRPLTFVAGLDLAELPAGEYGLPAEGWVLIYADATDEGLEELAGGVRATPGGPLCVFHAWPADVAEAHAPTPPEVVVAAQPVRAVPQLTLRDDEGVGEDLELSAEQEELYLEWLTEGEVLGPLLVGGLNPVGAQSLGWATGAQPHSWDDHGVLLLMLGDSEGLEVFDGGLLQVRVDPEAARRGDWQACWAIADSG